MVRKYNLGGGATYYWQVPEGGGTVIFVGLEKQNLRSPPLP